MAIAISPDLFKFRVNPEKTLSLIESARKLIPDVANTLSPNKESVDTTRIGIEQYFGEWEKALKSIISSRFATKKFILPFHQPDQQYLHDTLELVALHQTQFFEALNDPTGVKARLYRPTQAQIEQVTSLINPILPENSNAITPLGQAFEKYAKKHPDNLMAIAPTILLEILGAANYQANSAPYGGIVEQLTKEFYEKYYNTIPPGLETTNRHTYERQFAINKFIHMIHFENIKVGLLGVGQDNEQIIHDGIQSYRRNIRMFSDANEPIKFLGINLFPKSQAPEWLDQYHQLSLDQIYHNPELKSLVHQLFSFGSVYMDIIEIVKYLQSILGASHLLKRNGRLSDDQALPFTYRDEIELYHQLHPQEPYGMFWRNWRTAEEPRPNKLFYAMPLATSFLIRQLAGLKPESFNYADAMYLQHKLELDPNFLSHPQSTLRQHPWLIDVLNTTVYQTEDTFGREYHRATITYKKTQEPTKFLTSLTNFLARSPAFAPKLKK